MTLEEDIKEKLRTNRTILTNKTTVHYISCMYENILNNVKDTNKQIEAMKWFLDKFEEALCNKKQKIYKCNGVIYVQDRISLYDLEIMTKQFKETIMEKFGD